MRDTDHLVSVAFEKFEMVTDGVFSRPEFLRHWFISDRYLGGVLPGIVFIKFSAAQQTNPHRIKVPRRGRIDARHHPVCLSGFISAVGNDGPTFTPKS